MGGLDIGDITIGYSATGARTYVNDLNTKVISETSTIITNSIQNIVTVFQTKWQGSACESYSKLLNKSGEDLKSGLKQMEAIFEATIAAQEETYHEEDTDMAGVIDSANIF